MIAAGGYLELLRGAFAGHAIDQSVLSGYAPRPPSFERVLERLGFAEPLKWNEENGHVVALWDFHFIATRHVAQTSNRSTISPSYDCQESPFRGD